MLAGADEGLTELAFQYGRNVGLAFQLVDDLLDFVASSSALGKPAAADLKLGLATAPVLFACEKVGVTRRRPQSDREIVFRISPPYTFSENFTESEDFSKNIFCSKAQKTLFS